MKKFNINDEIYIQITEPGWRHLQEAVGPDYIENCIKTPGREVTINNETWYKLQCCQVMEILPINFGGQPLFNTNILIDDKNLKVTHKPETAITISEAILKSDIEDDKIRAFLYPKLYTLFLEGKMNKGHLPKQKKPEDAVSINHYSVTKNNISVSINIYWGSGSYDQENVTMSTTAWDEVIPKEK